VTRADVIIGTRNVKARNGDGDSPVRAWAHTNQDDAVAMVERLLSTGGDGWRNLANTVHPPQPFSLA
jgi:hypothetical protein